jgi:hypothetical protein
VKLKRPQIFPGLQILEWASHGKFRFMKMWGLMPQQFNWLDRGSTEPLPKKGSKNIFFFKTFWFLNLK